ncbi:MAG: OmpA family protein [Hyphomonadaceae bacterium]|nr:OmpA family protein [Clostridia bacterium]
MKMHQEEEHEKESGERWVLTYADLITLLMVFFVVMYSMSSIDSKKYEAVAAQLSVTLGGADKSVIAAGVGKESGSSFDKKTGSSMVSSKTVNDKEPVDIRKGENEIDRQKQAIADSVAKAEARAEAAAEAKILDNVEGKIKEFIKEQNLSMQVTVNKDSRGTVISFTEALLFEKGSADIQTDRIMVVKKIAEIISQTVNFIRVEGFTDDLPIHTAKFDSNWELAAQRAINVGKSLIGEGINTNRISCLSYGEYRPMAPNDSEANRRKNRRVDIVLIYKTLDNLEPGMNH